jgi:hypothetical protein
MKRVAITGLGLLTPLGNTVNEFWQNIVNGKSGAGPITKFDASRFKTRFGCEVKGFHPENYFEETLAPVVSHVPSAGAGENGAAEVQLLTPRPEPVDGKPALAPTSESAEAAETHDPHEITQERLLALISVMIALTGIGIGWFMFNRQPLMRMPRLLENKYYVDEIYDATIIQPINVGSREGLWKIIDAGVIDGVLVHGVGAIVRKLGGIFRYMQIGFVRGYAAIILAGALIIIGYFAYTGANVLRLLVR